VSFQPQDSTGKLLAPITLPYQGERPFVPEATGGTPEELTPFGQQFKTMQAAALESEKDAAARALTYETDTLRKRLGVEQEVMAEWFGENTLLEVDRARALGDVETNQMLERQAEGLQLAYKDDLLRLDDQGEFAKAMFAQEEKLAKMRALVSDQPVIYDRLLPNGEVATVMLHRGATGQFKFSRMGATLPGSPYSAYAQSEMLDPLNQILRVRSAQGQSVNLSDPETMTQVTAAAGELGIPEEAVIGLQQEQIRVRNDPTLDGLPDDVTDIYKDVTLGEYNPTDDPNTEQIFLPTGEVVYKVPDEATPAGTVQYKHISGEDVMNRDLDRTRSDIADAEQQLQALLPQIDYVDLLPAGVQASRREELLRLQEDLETSLVHNNSRLLQIQDYFRRGVESRPPRMGLDRSVPTYRSNNWLREFIDPNDPEGIAKPTPPFVGPPRPPTPSTFGMFGNAPEIRGQIGRGLPGQQGGLSSPDGGSGATQLPSPQLSSLGQMATQAPLRGSPLLSPLSQIARQPPLRGSRMGPLFTEPNRQPSLTPATQLMTQQPLRGSPLLSPLSILARQPPLRGSRPPLLSQGNATADSQPINEKAAIDEAMRSRVWPGEAGLRPDSGPTTGSVPGVRVPREPTAITARTITLLENSPHREEIESAVARAAKHYNVPSWLMMALIAHESLFDPNAEGWSDDEVGLMQIHPRNVEKFGMTNPWDIGENTMAGARLLRELWDRFDGDLQKVIAAYNMGPRDVDRNIAAGRKGYSNQSYVDEIMENVDEFRY
jgi:soluble lytic murein transglycosylase-like protein